MDGVDGQILALVHEVVGSVWTVTGSDIGRDTVGAVVTNVREGVFTKDKTAWSRW